MTTPIPLTDEEIAELERLHAEATPGPWVPQGCYRGDERVLTGAVVADRDPSPDWPVIVRPPTEHLDPQAGANAAFIAATRRALPRLLATIAELKKELSEHDNVWLSRLEADDPVAWLREEMQHQSEVHKEARKELVQQRDAAIAERDAAYERAAKEVALIIESGNFSTEQLYVLKLVCAAIRSLAADGGKSEEAKKHDQEAI